MKNSYSPDIFSGNQLDRQRELILFGNEFIAEVQRDYIDNPNKYLKRDDFKNSMSEIALDLNRQLEDSLSETEGRIVDITYETDLGEVVSETMLDIYDTFILDGGIIQANKRKIGGILSMVMDKGLHNSPLVANLIKGHNINNIDDLIQCVRDNKNEGDGYHVCPVKIKNNNKHMDWIINAINLVSQISQKK